MKYLAFLALFLLFACGNNGEESLPALTASQREMIDTLYLRRVAVLRPQMDSTCDANFAANVQRAVDSLMKIRREEEARLRQRVLQQEGAVNNQ
ncbi:MAG: hypothetical protein ACK4TA_03455 [Saprospiraceae bacterium]